MKKVLSVMLAVCLCLSIGTCLGESKTYEVGVVQLVQHVALDAATQGFIDALTEKLGLGDGKTGGFVHLSSEDVSQIYKIAAKATL